MKRPPNRKRDAKPITAAALHQWEREYGPHFPDFTMLERIRAMEIEQCEPQRFDDDSAIAEVIEMLRPASGNEAATESQLMEQAKCYLQLIESERQMMIGEICNSIEMLARRRVANEGMDRWSDRGKRAFDQYETDLKALIERHFGDSVDLKALNAALNALRFLRWAQVQHDDWAFPLRCLNILKAKEQSKTSGSTRRR